MKKTILFIFSLMALGCNSYAQKSAEKQQFPIQKSESEWKAELSSQEFQVLRKKGTERAFTSELLDVKEPGTFVCAACGNELYRTEHKFNSGTGWPSFDRAFNDDNLVYRRDNSYGYTAIEVRCADCGGHLGHIFNDGPKETTGKRHCINGIAMDFVKD